MTPASAYYVDILHSKSAETMAASGSVSDSHGPRPHAWIILLTSSFALPCRAFRALIIALVTAVMLPLINTIGVTATDTLFALFAWAGFGYVRTKVPLPFLCTDRV